VSSVRVWPGLPRRDWVSETRTEDTTPARVLMRVLIDGPGFRGSVVQLEPLRSSVALSQPGWAELLARRSRSSRRSRGRLAGRTGPSDMLAPTPETRRELSTAADDCVSSHAVVRGRQRLVPACRHERARTSHCLGSCVTRIARPTDEGFSYTAPPLAGAGNRSLWIAESGRTRFTNDSAVHIALPPAPDFKSGAKDPLRLGCAEASAPSR
jgi:hypothetical protein